MTEQNTPQTDYWGETLPAVRNNGSDVVDAEIVLSHDGGHGNLWTAKDHAVYGLSGYAAAKVIDSGVAPLVAAARPYEVLSSAEDLTAVRKDYRWPVGNSKQAKRLTSAVLGDRDVLTLHWYTPLAVCLAEKAKSEPVADVSQWRPSHPEKDEKGNVQKYETPAGSSLSMGVHPATPSADLDNAPVVFLAEGMLKGDAVLTAALLAAGVKPKALKAKVGKDKKVKDTAGQRDALRKIMNGLPAEKKVLVLTAFSVTAWRKNPEWRHMNLKDRQVYVGFDGDTATNHMVFGQARDLRSFVKDSHKASSVDFATPVDPTGADEKIGADDYLAKHGTWSNLVAMASPNLPEMPAKPIAGGRPLESEWIEPGNGVMVRRAYIVTQRDANGNPLNSTVTETPVVNASVEIIATEETVSGYPDELGRDRVETNHDLRVVAGRTPSVVRGWNDTALRDFEGIQRQAGAAARTSAWHEPLTPKLRDELAIAIRSNPVPDCEQRLAIRRHGLVDLGPEYIPAKTDENAPDLERIWAWTTASGTVAPRGYEAPRVRAEVAKGPEPHRIPAESTIEQMRSDVKSMLMTVPSVMKDATIYHATLGKTIQAILGGHPTGGVYASADPGSGKSVILRLCLAINFGGLPTSMVNSTKAWIAAATAGRTDILTAADDLRREPGDEKTWPHVHSAADTLLRLSYDGPQAARGRMELDQATGKYKAGEKDEAWPAVVLFSELHADFADSTMERTLVIHSDRDMIVEGKAKDVLQEQVTDMGVPQRLGREFLADVLLDLSVKASEGVEWAQDHRSLMAHRDSILAAQVRRIEEVYPSAKTWTSRQREVAVGPLLGIAALAKWARAVVAGDTNPDGMTVEQVDEWETRAKKDILDAQQKHHESTTGEGARDRSVTLIDSIRRAIVTGTIVLAPGTEAPGSVREVKPGATVYGIGGVDEGEQWIFVMPEAMTDALGCSVRDIETALKNAGAVKTSDGKWRHRKTHHSAQVKVMKIRERDLLGSREEDSKGHLKVVAG